MRPEKSSRKPGLTSQVLNALNSTQTLYRINNPVKSLFYIHYIIYGETEEEQPVERNTAGALRARKHNRPWAPEKEAKPGGRIAEQREMTEPEPH